MKKKKINDNDIWTIICILISFTVIFLVHNYMLETKNLYYWDSVGYWERSIELIDNFKISIFNGIGRIVYSVLFNDYNSISSIFPSILMAIFNKSRYIYTLGITIFYLIPSLISIIYLIKKIIPSKINFIYKIISSFIILLFVLPGLLYLNYYGYVDLAGIFFMILIYYFHYFYKTDSNKKNIIKNLLVGLFLIILFFIRRWYSFFVVSFFLSNFILDFVNIILSKKEIKNNIKEMFFKYFNIAISIFAVVAITIIIFLVQKNYSLDNYKNLYIYKLLFVDYSDLYSAYKFSITTDISLLFKFYGKLLIFVFFIASISLLFVKKYRKKIIYPLFQLLICFVLFMRTQSHDIHHCLLYLVPIIYILILFIVNLLEKKKYIIIYVVLFLSLINFFMTLPYFNNFNFSNFLKKNTIIPTVSLIPYIRTDIKYIEDINTKIKELSENGTKKVYINCSSGAINDSVIYNFDRSMEYNYDYKTYLLGVSHVDKRDGVPYHIDEADIVIVSSPDQVHLKNAEKEQKIISYVNSVFLNNKNIAKSYALIYKYEFLGISIYFYEKNKEIEKSDYDAFIIDGEKYIE